MIAWLVIAVFVGAAVTAYVALASAIGRLLGGAQGNAKRIREMEDDLADVRWILDAPRRSKPFRRSDWLEGHDVD